MYSLETSVQINQVSFNIRNKGDYRMVLDCFEALNDTELSELERLYSALIIFYEDFNDVEDFPDKETLTQLVYAMFDFFNQHEDIQSNTQDIRVIDWDKDSNLISSAINKVAGQEIRGMDYLHWWTFLGYYMAIGECLFSNVVSIRYKSIKGDKLEKHERKFKQDNPQYFTIDFRTTEQKEADEYVRQLWGDG